jgi:uncharacterized protein (TIGR02453 family)
MANTFKGFPPEAVDFLAKLEANNDRAWFNAHKADYERACKEPMQQLLDDLDAKFGSGASKLYRIHRDVRFSKDKTPYKTWQAAHFAAGYLSLSPDGLYVGTGAFMLDGPTLERYRRAVDDDRTGAELVKVQAALKKKGYVVEGHGDALKIVPRGYPKDHPRAELLKQKSVLVGKNFEPREVTSPKLTAAVIKVITDVKPLTSWLDANVWM